MGYPPTQMELLIESLNGLHGPSIKKRTILALNVPFNFEEMARTFKTLIEWQEQRQAHALSNQDALG